MMFVKISRYYILTKGLYFFSKNWQNTAVFVLLIALKVFNITFQDFHNYQKFQFYEFLQITGIFKFFTYEIARKAR